MSAPGSTRRVGIVASYLLQYGRELINAILEYKFKSASSHWETVYISQWGSFSFDGIRKARLDGLIAPIYEYVDEFRSLNIPIVNITEPPADCPFPTVTFDNRRIGEIAAEEFVSLELSRCYWKGWNDRIAAVRCGAFCEYLDRHAIDTQELEFRIRWDSRESLVGGRDVGSIGLRADDAAAVGIFCATDIYAFEVLRSCWEARLKVPDHVAVIGVDNDSILCQSAVPELTSIRTSSAEVGAQAAAQLDRLLQGMPPTQDCVRVPPKGIVHRHSTYRVDCDDALVAETLRFIRSHIGHYFDISDILRRTGVSRSTLEKRFRGYTGTTLHRKIVAERLLRAEGLLLESELLQEDIARQSGFPNPHAFHMAFRRKHGCTPAQFRATRKG